MAYFYSELSTSPIFENFLDSYFLLGLKSSVIVSHSSFIVLFVVLCTKSRTSLCRYLPKYRCCFTLKTTQIPKISTG